MRIYLQRREGKRLQKLGSLPVHTEPTSGKRGSVFVFSALPYQRTFSGYLQGAAGASERVSAETDKEKAVTPD